PDEPIGDRKPQRRQQQYAAQADAGEHGPYLPGTPVSGIQLRHATSGLVAHGGIGLDPGAVGVAFQDAQQPGAVLGFAGGGYGLDGLTSPLGLARLQTGQGAEQRQAILQA